MPEGPAEDSNPLVRLFQGWESPDVKESPQFIQPEQEVYRARVLQSQLPQSHVRWVPQNTIIERQKQILELVFA